MLKWGQTVVDWKRLTATKVCDSFDLCRQLMFLMLDEFDRLAWDMFLLENKIDIARKKESDTISEDEFLFVLVDDYLTYLQSKADSTNDERRKYMLYFILMGRKFRQFWYAMRRGDRIIQEYITIKWIGIFYMLKKHNYFEICLNVIETEYAGISYKELQAIRMNASVRYRTGKDTKGNPYPLHVLDEVMENINAWTKRLLLGPDEISWRIHSPNLMCAHRSNNFESDAFTKQRIEWNTNDEPTTKQYVSNSTKTTEPRKNVERRRMYEWIVLMFGDEVTRHIIEKDGFEKIKHLTTTLTKPLQRDVNTDEIDHLENCIDNIFNTIDSIETMPIVDEPSIDTSHEDNNIIDDEAVEDNTSSNNDINRGKIHSLSLVNVFDEANKKLIEIDVNQVRLNKKNRLKRSDEFYRDIYNQILNNNDELDDDCNDILKSTVTSKPWFMSTYDMLL